VSSLRKRDKCRELRRSHADSVEARFSSTRATVPIVCSQYARHSCCRALPLLLLSRSRSRCVREVSAIPTVYSRTYGRARIIASGLLSDKGLRWRWLRALGLFTARMSRREATLGADRRLSPRHRTPHATARAPDWDRDRQPKVRQCRAFSLRSTRPRDPNSVDVRARCSTAAATRNVARQPDRARPRLPDRSGRGCGSRARRRV